MQIPALFLAAILGACVGSFLNVLIMRIPRKEEFVRTPSHCMRCGKQLRWYEMIPVVSWLIQKGRCRGCGGKISAQYPFVEISNAAMWCLTVFLLWSDPVRMMLYCILFSLLLVLSVIDWRTFEIPFGLNLAIGVLGLVQLVADLEQWSLYVIGFFSVSLVFLALHFLTGGAGLGMGDVKLVAAAGLLLGWPRMIFAVMTGSIIGVLIHSIRMKKGAGRKLAFGPYLALGIWLSALFGDPLIAWYMSLFGF